jgi:hypothetical protein
MAKRRPGYLLRLDSRVLDVAELLAEHFDGADRAATGAVYKSLPARMGARVFGRRARTLRRRASPRS